FRTAKKLFQEQVESKPITGQRNHLDKLRRGRAHITGAVSGLPTSQAILHAVEFTGRYKGAAQPQLIDGYQRMAYWMGAESSGCPFDKLVLITHKVNAGSAREA